LDLLSLPNLNAPAQSGQIIDREAQLLEEKREFDIQSLLYQNSSSKEKGHGILSMALK